MRGHPQSGVFVPNFLLLTGREPFPWQRALYQRLIAGDWPTSCVLPEQAPLAISTLRGEFRDNRAWREDPARPAIIIGTIDVIGSRLLFSGYGCGFKSRPLPAGFLGQDALLVIEARKIAEGP